MREILRPFGNLQNRVREIRQVNEALNNQESATGAIPWDSSEDSTNQPNNAKRGDDQRIRSDDNVTSTFLNAIDRRTSAKPRISLLLGEDPVPLSGQNEVKVEERHGDAYDDYAGWDG